MSPSRAIATLALGLSLAAAASARGEAAPRLQAPPAPTDQPPVSVLVSPEVDASGVRVTLTFSRPVDYRLDESRSRLRLLVLEPVSDSSLLDRDLDSDVVKRVRVESGSRGAEVVFHLGRAFETFSSSEQREPFRVVVQFRREGSGLAAQPEEEPGREDGPPPAAGWPQAELPGGPRTVIIDPGHGGEEEGAVSRSGLKEKDLVLDIARRLRARLEESGYAVGLTRDDDLPLALMDRTAMANHARAGLFLSIHANSSMRPEARGAETYFLSSAAGEEETVLLTRQENLGAPAPPGGPGEKWGGEVETVLWDMAQSEHLASSSRLAELIQSEMNAVGGSADRGVKQAPFRVLAGATMPAALVEVGFLTNAEDEGKLAAPHYREEIARALAAAVDLFTQERQRLEASLATAPPGGSPP